MVFKAVGLDVITQGGNVERKEQQAPEGVLEMSSDRGGGEEAALADRLTLAWVRGRGEDSMADLEPEGRGFQ